MNRNVLILVLISALPLGCATIADPPGASFPPPAATAGELELSLQSTAQPSPPLSQQPLEQLTLEQAFELAESAHPDLAAAQADIQEAEGQALQAGLFPNPALIARTESVRFSGSPASQAELIAGLSQPIPLGKRLSAARRVENLERDRRIRELAAKRIDIRIRIQRVFAGALYWQQNVEAWQQALQIAQNGVEVAQARVDAGYDVPTEVEQAKIERQRAQLELKRTQSRLMQGIDELRIAIGAPALPISSLQVSLDDISLQAPSLEPLLALLEANPLLASAQAHLAVMQARVDLAKEQAKPDLDLELSYRRIGDSGNSVDLGIKVPLSIFNRNQGAIHAAEAATVAAEARVQSLRNELDLKLRDSHRALTLAIDAAELLRQNILPQSRIVLQTAEIRYTAGDISLTEILPLRRDSISLQLDYLDTLKEIMEAWALLTPYLQ